MPPDDEDAFAILSQVADQYLDRELERDEVIQIRDAINQHLLPVMEHPCKIFLLGSYGEEEKERLRQVQTILNEFYRIQGSSDARVYLMEDIPGTDVWINLDVKFRLLADIADSLVGVAEHDRGGFMFEQGILSTDEKYRQKTIIIKREYRTNEEEHDHFSAMQSSGIFSELDRQDRLFRWETGGELIEATGDAFHAIESER